MVPKAGLEPAQLSPLPPQGSVSTNSTTWALTLSPYYSGISEDVGLELAVGILASIASSSDSTVIAGII